LKNTNNILFRCDQNQISGFGHFSRCLNLARHLSFIDGVTVSFLGNYEAFSLQLLKQYKIDYRNILSTDFSFFDTSFYNHFTHLVVDSYLINEQYIQKTTKLDLFTIFIDDTNIYNYRDVNLVINIRLAVEHFKYGSKKVITGAPYFIFKPEFLDIRKQKIEKQKIERILIFIGGAVVEDSLIIKLVDTIFEINNKLTIDIIGKEITSINKIVNFHPPTFDIEKLYKKTDLVINGGGLTKYECCFMGIPSASFATTLLQHEDSNILENIGLICNLGLISSLKEDALETQIHLIISNSNYRKQLVKKCKQTFTEKSIKNIINYINLK